MNYADYRASSEPWRRAAEEAVTVVEAAPDGDPALAHARETMDAALDGRAFTAREWAAFLANARKLRGVKRITGGPYAAHPTRMALLVAAALPPDDRYRESSVVAALLHDYLEEGDGVDAAGVQAMLVELPDEPLGSLAAVVLTEPLVDAERLLPKFRNEVTYVAQLTLALPALAAPMPLANASLADKIDNLHDLSYITRRRKKAPGKTREKLATKLAYFRWVLDAVGPFAAASLSDLLRAAIAARMDELELRETDVAPVLSTMRALKVRHEGELRARIAAFHRKMPLEELRKVAHVLEGVSISL